MTERSEDEAVHATLVANVHDKVTLRRRWDAVEIVNSGDTALYFLAGRSDTEPPEPAVGGANTKVVHPGGWVLYKLPERQGQRGGPDDTIVTLKSAGTPSYSVTGVDL